MKTNQNHELISKSQEHTHPPDHSDIIRSNVADKIKKLAVTESNSSRRSIVIRTLSEHDTELASANLPSTKSMQEKVSRERRRHGFHNFNTVKDIFFTREQRMFSDTEMFLIHDSSPSEDERRLVFVSSHCSRALETCEHIFVDGTFDAAPKGFSQVVSIHGKFFHCF